MTTPDLLTTVGFEKTKIGAGDKEVGYQINESSACSLLGSVILCFAVMGFLTVSMVYDIHFERKTLHRQVRVEEHHAATKLAQVHMELWSQYRDDIQESHEAANLLKKLNASYDNFRGKFKGATSTLAADFNIHPDKAANLADKILHLVADMQQDNIKHTRQLVDHLIAAGKRSVHLEKHMDREVMEELKEEKKRMAEDSSEGYNVTQDEGKDPLRAMLGGFFDTYDDYKREFGGSVRENFTTGGTVYKELVALQAKIRSDDPPSEMDVTAELDKIDLASVGAGLGSGRVLPVFDIVDELVMVPKLPFGQVDALQQHWRAGDADSVDILEALEELEQRGEIPAGWLQQGVHRDEDEEEEEEQQQEKLEIEG